MKNLTKTKTGKFLLDLGFEKVNYRLNSRLNAVGLCYYGNSGEDLICIEPCYYQYKPYKITGSLVSESFRDTNLIWCDCKSIKGWIEQMVRGIRFYPLAYLNDDKKQILAVRHEYVSLNIKKLSEKFEAKQKMR